MITVHTDSKFAVSPYVLYDVGDSREQIARALPEGWRACYDRALDLSFGRRAPLICTRITPAITDLVTRLLHRTTETMSLEQIARGGVAYHTWIHEAKTVLDDQGLVDEMVAVNVDHFAWEWDHCLEVMREVAADLAEEEDR